jgi:hypothetical protein
VIPGNETILGNIISPGTTSLTNWISFVFNSSPFVDCTAYGFTKAPTVSGSVVTFPTNGSSNGGSITCTDFAGRVTTQSVPNAAGGTSSQTFDLTTQFATSGATWTRLDPALSGGSILLNAPNITVQNGTMVAGAGGTITATTAGGFTGSPASLALVPPGTATTTPLTAIQSGLATGSEVRWELGRSFSSFDSGLLFYLNQGGASSPTNRFGLQLPGGTAVWVDGVGTWNAANLKITNQYTVATLPTASTLSSGTAVLVTDASSFTPGTCTGGGSDIMLAITNGSSWSCH